MLVSVPSKLSFQLPRSLLTQIWCSLHDFSVYGGGEICLDPFQYRLRSFLLFAECTNVFDVDFFKTNLLHSRMRDYCHNFQHFTLTS